MRPKSLTLGGFLLLVTIAPGADLRNRLETPVDRYTIAAANFMQAWVAMATDFHLPVGLEWVRTQTARRVDRTWTHATVLSILRELAADQPGYELRIVGGVIQITPSDALTDSHDILNLPIVEFSAPKSGWR